MKKMRFIFASLLLLLSISLRSQEHTIGLLSYVPEKAFDGFNLFFPNNQSKAFLINNCGELVNVWDDDPDFRPGNIAYLLENGNLIKCKRHRISVNDPIWSGGGGAIVEIRDWDNNLLWSFEQNDAQRRLHHDIAPMPSGNILMISWEHKTAQQAIQAGRDPALLPQGEFLPDYILEIDPATDEIVWEWHTLDHLIQDYDPAKENYGIVEEHPELIDLNWDNNDGNRDWMHSNAIDYNPELDQILLSVVNFDEVWIIDHSTSKEEAAGHNGGLSGRGGDILYRWGNPVAYRAGTPDDQKLFFPHDIHWVDDFVDSSFVHYGKLAVFNNQVNAQYSTVDVFNPAFDRHEWSYVMNDSIWGPDGFDLTITHPEPTQLHSETVSSVQFLPNGNALICSGRWGYTFEITPENEIVWEYKTPLIAGAPASQGDVPGINSNLTFRFKRYPADYPAFEGRDLSPQGFIELDPDTAFCDQILSATEEVLAADLLRINGNPFTEFLTFEAAPGIVLSDIVISNEFGQSIWKSESGSHFINVRTSDWPAGLYFLHFAWENRRFCRKVVKL